MSGVHRGLGCQVVASGWNLNGRCPVKGCSSTGRAAVSKTAGCRFKSCRPCVDLDNNPTGIRSGEAEDHQRE